MLTVKVVVDLRKELSKRNEVVMSESSVAENWKNEEEVAQMGCSQEDPNEVSPDQDNPILPLEKKNRKLKRPRLSSKKRKQLRGMIEQEHLSLWGSFVEK